MTEQTTLERMESFNVAVDVAGAAVLTLDSRAERLLCLQHIASAIIVSQWDRKEQDIAINDLTESIRRRVAALGHSA